MWNEEIKGKLESTLWIAFACFWGKKREGMELRTCFNFDF